MSEEQVSYPYVVRGAKIYCAYGSHIRQLDMPVAHGAYIRDKPMMNEKDCEVGLDANIAPFGACQSPDNPNKKIEINDGTNAMQVPTDESCENFAPPSLPIQGRLCTPMLGEKWCDAKEDTLVDGLPALTTNCTLACCYGGTEGVIGFMDDGQEVG